MCVASREASRAMGGGEAGGGAHARGRRARAHRPPGAGRTTTGTGQLAGPACWAAGPHSARPQVSSLFPISFSFLIF